ncbi:ABC transporter ATP-binding protein [Mycetocola reblochoni]|uniref:ABC-type Fe3+-siderophore transport system, ATPase component n=2 Tax=Mycetocola reblochoni TaxID=331618 RepID=A0A1R4IC72_9MICO|nr:ABC transporter ATP-binding protein [Mycetocola reblochoni]RLP69136.1 ABC transporter ATP-binding protein [Mycetocola reblochoni]SJN17437.1 ABC-type Fe3+-siderophore transport system, ATPase component [Mycetocola reblochoni REB411]
MSTSTPLASSAPDGGATIACRSLSASYDGETAALAEVTLELPRGRFTAVIGPNGSGKSTLLSCLARQMPHTGSVLLDGAEAGTIPRKAFARRVAFLPQSPTAPDGVIVRGLVERGRGPHRSPFAPLRAADHAAVDAALSRLGLDELADRPLSSLSGGQRQRAWIALVLAQDAPVLLLDEPTAFLDLAHQAALLELARSLAGEGRTIVAVLHDLNLATAFADEIVVLGGGGVRAQGAPAEVVTPALLGEVFALHSDVIDDPVTGAPVILPRPAATAGAERTPS